MWKNHATVWAATILAATTGVNAVFPDCSNGPLAKNNVCNPALTAPERARALIAAMTTAEKIANLINTAPGAPRIGLPPYEWWSEALHGIADCPGVHFAKQGEFSYATSFPMPINLGAAFDDEGVLAMGKRIALDGRAFNNNNRSGLDFWTPNINPFRDPRWGRGSETPGEDTYHIGRYIKNLLAGMGHREPGNPLQPVIATCKHFAAFDMEGSPHLNQTSRFNFDAKVSMQELAEYYLAPFKSCVDADVGAIMCSYNSINGVPACANEFLMQKVLREHWGWNQETKWVTSDCQAIQYMMEGHNYTHSKAETAATSLKAGTDLECGTYYEGRFAFYDELPTALNKSLVSVAHIDKALVRLYSSLVSLGYFDPLEKQSKESQRLRQIGWKDISVTQDDLAYKLAVESVVLVKNNGLLPLALSTKIALIGPWANATTQLQGNYAGIAPHLSTILQGAQALPISVKYAFGTNITSLHNSSQNALEAARSSDVIIFAGGIDGTVETEGKDRTNIAWPAAQLALLRSLRALNKPIVVVQLGSPVDSSELLNGNVDGFLWAGYPGQEGGRAIMDVIFGKQQPSGRMPVTVYPSSYTNDVAITDMSLRPGTSNKNLGRTYVWYTGKPVIPFGHGLSYTNWTYSWRSSNSSTKALRFSLNIQDRVSMGQVKQSANTLSELNTELFRLTARVQNTGSRNSSHVVQTYVTANVGPAPYPKQNLVGYGRTRTLSPGSFEDVEFPILVQNLARTETNGSKTIYPGAYTIWLGADRSLSFNFTLAGQAEIVDNFPIPK